MAVAKLAVDYKRLRRTSHGADGRDVHVVLAVAERELARRQVMRAAGRELDGRAAPQAPLPRRAQPSARKPDVA